MDSVSNNDGGLCDGEYVLRRRVGDEGEGEKDRQRRKEAEREEAEKKGRGGRQNDNIRRR